MTARVFSKRCITKLFDELYPCMKVGPTSFEGL